MSNIAIQINNVGKLYRLGMVGTGTLAQDINRWWKMSVQGKGDPYMKIGEKNVRSEKGKSDFVWALQNINLEIEKGDVVGFIGKNGAGKSTLLKLLSRITTPTVGEIRMNGSLSSLLEVGTGFHWELTGRENVFLNGAILGMKRREIARKFDDIVDFAGISKYIDTPAKRYSSGMMVRLGFAVAAFLEPDILVVDEVLAVGDAEFQKMAVGKMQDVSQKGGRTVLFVSHNMGMMQQLCHRGFLLEDGCLKFSGSISDAIAEYQNSIAKRTQFNGVDGLRDVLYLQEASVTPKHGKSFCNSLAVCVEMTVVVNVSSLSHLVIGFNLYSRSHSPLARADYNDENLLTTLSPGVYHFVFEIPPYTLSDGNYQIVFDLWSTQYKQMITENSRLSFTMVKDEKLFGNVYNESIPQKNSIIRGRWLKEMIKE